MTAAALCGTFIGEDGTFLVDAIDKDSDTLAGHAFARRFSVPTLAGSALWITQLVVNNNYRNRGIGAHLISTALDHKDVSAGIVISHPYAVWGLEKACRQECSVEFTCEWGQNILQYSGVSYLDGRAAVLGAGSCKVDTQFYVDHTEMNQILKGLVDQTDTKWVLGTIEDGEEFVAIVDLRQQ